MEFGNETPQVVKVAATNTSEFGNSAVAIQEEEEIPFPSSGFVGPRSFPHDHDDGADVDISVRSDSDYTGGIMSDGVAGMSTPIAPPSPPPSGAVAVPGDMPLWALKLFDLQRVEAAKDIERIISEVTKRQEASNASIHQDVGRLTDKMDTMFSAQNKKDQALTSRIDSLVSRLDDFEKRSTAHSSGLNVDHGNGASVSPPSKFGRIGPPPDAASSSKFRFGASSPGLFSGPTSNTQEMAKRATCLRLRGFKYKLPKPDMVAVATKLCKHVGIPDGSIITIHSSAIAGSCVVEFVTEQDTKDALQSSKSTDLTWTDPVTRENSVLYFAYDESEEVRMFGRAIHTLYDSIAKHIIPHGPPGTKFQSHRAKGLVQLGIQGRFYPIFQIGTNDDGATFQFIEKKGRWISPMLPPPWVTHEMLATVKNETSTNGILNMN